MIPLPFNGMPDLVAAGQMLAQAGFPGVKNAAEGYMVATVCYQLGISYLEFQQKYFFRQGRFSIQAHELLAQFVARGGSYHLEERCPTRAALTMTKDGNVYLSELTWDQALQEPFVYCGSESAQLAELAKPVAKRQLKPKYSTPRSRQQMLWARVISDGVVCTDPGARGGMYTPEETDDIIDVTDATAATSAGPTPVAIPVEVIAQRVEAVAAAAVSFTPPAPAKPAVVVPAVDPEPNPFLMAAAKGINFLVCPIPECAVTGKPWSEFDVEDLKVAAEFQHPAMLAEHYQAIRDALAAKGWK